MMATIDQIPVLDGVSTRPEHTMADDCQCHPTIALVDGVRERWHNHTFTMEATTTYTER